jgi:hypothetical protein
MLTLSSLVSYEIEQVIYQDILILIITNSAYQSVYRLHQGIPFM